MSSKKDKPDEAKLRQMMLDGIQDMAKNQGIPVQEGFLAYDRNDSPFAILHDGEFEPVN